MSDQWGSKFNPVGLKKQAMGQKVNAELEFTILLKKLSYNKPDILTCPAVRHQYYRK